MAKTQTSRKPTTKEKHRRSKTSSSSSSTTTHNHQLEPNVEPEKPPPLPSWVVMKSILTCKHLQIEQQQHPQRNPQQQQHKQKKLKQKQPEQHQEPTTTEDSITSKKTKKMKCTGGAGSICNNTKVMQRPQQQHQDHHSSSLPAASPDPLLYRRAKPSSSSSSSSSLMSISAAGSNSVNDGGSNRSMTSGGGGGGGISSSSSSSYSVSSHNPLASGGGNSGGSSSSSFKGMPFRRLSGCYECRMVVDPVLGFTRDPSLRATICTCPDCGEIFMKPEYLEHHQATKHAVSELGPEDTSKNIVEIIFQSSWLRKQAAPVCKIDRILKVHNTPKTISRFEEYRDSIKSKASKQQHPRCVADGNELLRFHCTTFMCSLGLNGASGLCNQIPNCNVCGIIRNGFRVGAGFKDGILTTATSGRAHDRAEEEGSGVVVVGRSGSSGVPKRAMLVCRVIAGRVKKSGVVVVVDGGTSGGAPVEEFDSVAGAAGLYSNLDELYVFNPRAILPCFVVVYKGF